MGCVVSEVVLTRKQVKALEFLWFKYGNGGNMSTNENHKFIQRHIEGRPKDAQLFAHRITKDCREAFQRILDNDYRELHSNQLQMIEAGWDEPNTEEVK